MLVFPWQANAQGPMAVFTADPLLAGASGGGSSTPTIAGMPVIPWRQKPPVGTLLDPSNGLANGLIGYWPLNEGTGVPASIVPLSAAVSNVGTTNAMAWAASSRGPVLSSASASTNGVQIPVPDGSPLDLTGNTLSIACWFYQVSQPNYAFLLMKGTNAARQYYFALNQTGQAIIRYGLNGTTVGANASFTMSGGATWALNAWQHLALTYNGATVQFYLNGSSVGSVACTGSITRQAGTGLSFASNAGPGQGLVGQLDAPLVYGRALSADEVASLYRNSYQLLRPRRQPVWSPDPSALVPPTGQPVFPGVHYQFTTAIDATNLVMSAVVASNNQSIPGTTSYDSTTHIATFTASPTTPFVVGGKYVITVSGAAATDGTPMDPVSFPFIPGGPVGTRYVGRRGRRLGRLSA